MMEQEAQSSPTLPTDVFMQLRPKFLLVWRCLLVPHLKAGNSEAPGVVGGRHDRNQEGAFGNVLLVKLD